MWVTVRFRNGKETDVERRGVRLSEAQKEIVGLFSGTDKALPLREIGTRLSVNGNGNQLKQDLLFLRQLGIVEVTGKGRGALWKRRKGA